MSTFDGWEDQLYGDVMALPPGNELIHFRTKGSKNGVRRFQMPDGTWTPLGLKERKAREGWGETKAERKAAKLQKKAERREFRKARREAAKEAFVKKRASKNVKNLTDDELQKRINRVKKEIEYKELTKSPVVKTAEKLVDSYFKNKDKKLEREMKKAELIVKQQEARQKLLASKAALTQARGSILDNLTNGSKKMQAKTNLINAKADKTVRGAIRQAVSNVIRKEGDRIVSDMGPHSLTVRAGRKVKSGVKKAATTAKDMAVAGYAGAGNDYLDRIIRKNKKKLDKRRSNPLKG